MWPSFRTFLFQGKFFKYLFGQKLHWEGSATNGATPSRYYVVGGNTNEYPSRHFGLSEFCREYISTTHIHSLLM